MMRTVGDLTIEIIRSHQRMNRNTTNATNITQNSGNLVHVCGKSMGRTEEYGGLWGELKD